MQADLERFLALVRRELGAEDARVLEADVEAPPEGDLCMICRMGDGRIVVATFTAPPADREAKQRRLEILTSAFDAAFEEPAHGRRARAPVMSTLHDELSALCARAAALNVIVIDANSPVVWGAAHPEGVVAQPPLASSPRMAETPANDEGERGGGMAVASRRAVLAARALPDIAALRKGKHVRSVARDAEVPFVAHSFASIYLLVVVYDQPFDELRAERAIVDSLPRIERLVLALPPLDPPPPFEGAGAVALRRSRRR
ncbi:MAG TPA: hypothetical protein VGL81_07760 [Polyangiaceae bacterium]